MSNVELEEKKIDDSVPDINTYLKGEKAILDSPVIAYDPKKDEIENEFVHTVITDDERHLDVNVRILKRPRYSFGGYRDKRNGMEYYHAAVQTIVTLCHWRRSHYVSIASGKPYVAPKRVSRDVQTVDTRQHYVETNRDAGTQMDRPDLLPDETPTVTVIGDARRYEPSEIFLKRKALAVTLIQAWWRGTSDRAKVAKLVEEKEKALALAAEKEEARIKAEAEERERAIERRMKPRTRSDFELLYAELAEWVANQAWEINDAGLPESARLAALSLLLDKETRLLQTIDGLRTEAAKENKKIRDISKLDKIASPSTWQLSDGSTCIVHTPYSLRATALRDLYKGLEETKDIDYRLDILLAVKTAAREFDCELTRSIVQLVDREADLLHRGRSASSLEGLRTRLRTLFLQFCETPEFNPAALALIRHPGDAIKKSNTIPLTVNGGLIGNQTVGISVGPN